MVSFLGAFAKGALDQVNANFATARTERAEKDKQRAALARSLIAHALKAQGVTRAKAAALTKKKSAVSSLVPGKDPALVARIVEGNPNGSLKELVSAINSVEAIQGTGGTAAPAATQTNEVLGVPVEESTVAGLGKDVFEDLLPGSFKVVQDAFAPTSTAPTVATAGGAAPLQTRRLPGDTLIKLRETVLKNTKDFKSGIAAKTFVVDGLVADGFSRERAQQITAGMDFSGITFGVDGGTEDETNREIKFREIARGVAINPQFSGKPAEQVEAVVRQALIDGTDTTQAMADAFGGVVPEGNTAFSTTLSTQTKREIERFSNFEGIRRAAAPIFGDVDQDGNLKAINPKFGLNQVQVQSALSELNSKYNQKRKDVNSPTVFLDDEDAPNSKGKTPVTPESLAKAVIGKSIGKKIGAKLSTALDTAKTAAQAKKIIDAFKAGRIITFNDEGEEEQGESINALQIELGLPFVIQAQRNARKAATALSEAVAISSPTVGEPLTEVSTPEETTTEGQNPPDEEVAPPSIEQNTLIPLSARRVRQTSLFQPRRQGDPPPNRETTPNLAEKLFGLPRSLQSAQDQVREALGLSPKSQLQQEALQDFPGQTLTPSEQAIVSDEGERLDVYKDSLGILTVGTGHKVLPEDNLNLGDTITIERSRELLRADLVSAKKDAVTILKPLGKQPKIIEDVLTNMTFQMGRSRVRGFKKFLKALKAKNYSTAADEMLNSKWAQQTPDRANRLADQIRAI